jgi:hypothetical protein
MDDDAQQHSVDWAAAERSKQAWIVPACQMGMRRGDLVAALFGPGRLGAAT